MVDEKSNPKPDEASFFSKYVKPLVAITAVTTTLSLGSLALVVKTDGCGPVGKGLEDLIHWLVPVEAKKEQVKKEKLENVFDTVQPKIEFDVKTYDEKSIKTILDSIERVPDTIQQLINSYGGTIVVTDQPVVKTKAVKELERKDYKVECPNMDIKTASGVYLSASKKAVVNIKCPELGALSLHEYGHMVDHTLGYISMSDEFIDLFEKTKKVYWYMFQFEILDDNAAKNEVEFFAECFSMFYKSEKSNEKLKLIPEIHEYFSTIEERAKLKNVFEQTRKNEYK